MSSVALRFEDILEGQDRYPSGYVCPNENIAVWREFAKGKKINRAAGICSGGEVGLLSLLPYVKEELVLVDHSYGSLRYAIQKYLLIQRFGLTKAIELLNCRDAWVQVERRGTYNYPYYDWVENKESELSKAIQAIEEDMPPALLASRAVDKYGRPTHPRSRSGLLSSTTNAYRETMQAMWKGLGPYQRRMVTSKLDKVLFVHGDFQALKDKGPFDLFYLSNAHSGSNGNLSTPVLSTVTEAMNDGGWVLCTTPTRSALRKGWNLVKKVNVHESRYDKRYASGGTDLDIIGWQYYLYQIDKETA